MPLRREKGEFNSHLILLLYRGQYQLATNDAYYSDGSRYEPAVAAVNELKQFMPAAKTALVLGAGIGSMVYVLRKQGYDPKVTIVEMDKVILRMAMELFEGMEPQPQIAPVCMDARLYMAQNTAKFDLIFLDVFNGRVVPDFVTSKEFLMQCRSAVASGGHLAFNYMINDNGEWENVKQNFAAVFPEYKELNLGVNRVLIL